MAKVKTAISLPESLLKQAEEIASELQVSRSGIMALALSEFVRRYQNKQILDRINVAYSDNAQEEVLQPYYRHHHRQIAEKER